MQDIEKSRVEYVQRLETQLEHMAKELDKYKQIAETWEPKITTVTEPSTQRTTFGLSFGGKLVHATVTQQYLAETDLNSAASTIVDALVESLVVEQLRKKIMPDVERNQQNARATVGAGKW